MKKIFRITSYLLIALFLAVTLSGCAKKSTTSNQPMVIWGFEEEDAWKPVIKDFQKSYKGYDVVYKKQVLDSDYENRVLNSITSGAGPDVWAMPSDWVYRHREKLASMPDSLAKKVNLDKQYVPSVKESVYINNKIYALTPSVEPLMVFYNPTLFTSASKYYSDNNKGDSEGIKAANNLLKGVPQTWTNFVSTSNLITQSGVPGTALGTANIPYSQDILYLLMLQNETSVLSNDARSATFNLPKTTSTGEDDIPGKRALEFYTSFADPSSENFCWDGSAGDAVDAFANGQVGMVFGFSSLQSTLLQKYPNFKYKKAFVPQLSEDSNKITDYASFTAYGVSRFSKNPSVAWGVVDTLANGNSKNSFNSANKLYTSEKANNYDISLKSRTGNSPEKLSLATAHSLIKGRYPVQFDSIIKDSIYSVNSGTQIPAGALDLAADKITQLLRKEDW